MGPSDKTVYLVTGGSRGIGLGVTSLLAQRDNTLVFATARNPDAANELQALALAHTNVIPVALEVTSEDGARALVKFIEGKTGRVDVILANAGIGEAFVPALVTAVSEVRRHVEVDAIAPLLLFQHVYPLLKNSTSARFVAVSSRGGSIGSIPHLPFPNTAYGAAKAALNYIVTKLHAEHGEKDNMAIVSYEPGMTITDLTKPLLSGWGIPESHGLTIEQSARGVVKLLDEAKREMHGGKFFDNEGKEVPW
ncbi:hypothetical protein JCM10296v2_002796 [Rhodotorula toruloides]